MEWNGIVGAVETPLDGLGFWVGFIWGIGCWV